MPNERLLWRALNGTSMAEAWAIAHPRCWEIIVKVDGERLFTEVAHHDGPRERLLQQCGASTLAEMKLRGWKPLDHEA